MRLSPKQREALRLIAEGRFLPDLVCEEGEWYARWRPLGGEENDWVDAFVREAVVTRLSEDAEHQRHETLHDAWMMALRSLTGRVAWDTAECARFAAELREWSGCAEEDVEARRSIRFRFRREGEAFVVGCAVPKTRRGLRALGLSMFSFPPLRGLVRHGEELAVALSVAEAESFVRSGAREVREAGYAVEGCDLAVPVTAEAELDAGDALPPPGAAAAPVPLRLVVKVAGEPVTLEEVRFLLEQGSSLVFFRDRWIEVDRDILRQALRALERQAPSVAAPLAFAFGLGRIGTLELEEVRAHGYLRGLVNDLRRRRQGPLVDGAALVKRLREAGLRADLRGYQVHGVEWMEFLTSHGFGALLADDMGLGKTLQAIAWMLASGAGGAAALDAAAHEPFLVVAPLTLLANWQHEIARFAPRLKTYVHQGDRRHLALGFKRAALAADVVITSYTLLVKDYSLFSRLRWRGLVLDEAQAIKNPTTRLARAVCALAPALRVALSGTPIENSVEDIWSVEEFLNPGFLGDRKTFEERFAKPLEIDEQSAAGKRLRHALEPFVLRRLKTEPGIAAELGAKREIKEYCPLSPAQRADYERALEDFRAGERRPGDCFALITQLKLVCDGANYPHLAGGKMDLLGDLLAEIFAGGESALVFTQYAKVGAALQNALAERFNRRFPFLHGGLSARRREEEIAAFNERADRALRTAAAPNCFILSLKAGGFGLNLTKATHVIHYDRWWNPAVENQATDRAHRIGQTRTVFVHQFISTGTIEEHVDAILERKGRIAGTLVQSGEGFLAQLSPEEFAATVALDEIG